MIHCPACSSPTALKTWTRTSPDQDGNASEESGVALYCEERTCPHSREPIEEPELAPAL